MSEDDMTDRELLKLAAKAAGVVHDGVGYLSPTGLPIHWNPLNDDGDSLRLAVKLGMVIDVRYGSHKRHKNITTCVNYWITPDKALIITENAFDDYQAAIRKCIVRAAAEIGKTK